MAHKKLNLPTKTCVHCQRPFAWRKKWERSWDEVRFVLTVVDMRQNDYDTSHWINTG